MPGPASSTSTSAFPFDLLTLTWIGASREIVRPPSRAAREELGVGTDGGERRPELVRRIGDEAPQLLLRRGPRLEGGLDVRQHRVQREPQPTDLGSLVGRLDAPRKVAGRDRRGGLADRLERTESEAYDPEPERDERGQDGGRHEQFDEKQPVKRAVDVLQRGREHEDVRARARLD